MTMNILRRLLIALAALCFSCAAYCETPSDASVNTLLVVMKTENNMNVMFANMDKIMAQSMATATQGEQMTPEQLHILDAARAKFVTIMKEEFAWEKVRPQYVQVYQETFTQEEVDGLIQFFQSPVGVAYIDKIPTVMQKSMGLMQGRMAPLMEKMRAAMQEAVAESRALKQ